MYHWTHRSNLSSIAATGLDPQFARGKMRCVWLADRARIAWALAHVSAHHQVSPDEMVLLRVRVDGLTLVRTSWPLVLVCKSVVKPSKLAGVRAILDNKWTSIRRFR